MPLLRRTRYAFYYCEDRDFLDIAELLRGRAALAPLRQILALSILRGEEYPITKNQLDLLLSLPSDRWVDRSTVSATTPTLTDLVAKGLILTDELGEPAELRRREEALTSDQWNVYAALYHFMTKWRDVGLPTGDRSALETTHQEQLETMRSIVEEFGPPPRHFSSIPGATELIRLPLVETTNEMFRALLARKTSRSFVPERSLTANNLAVLLQYTFGCHGYANIGEGLTVLKKTSPSGGAMHPIEAYPLIRHVDGIQPGLYHYSVADHGLELMRLLEPAEAARAADELSAGQGYPADAAVNIFLTARFYRSYWKYRRHNRAYAVLLMDVAHLSQTFYLLCTHLNLGTFFTGAINHVNMEDFLGVDGFTEGALAMCGCGYVRASGSPLDPEFVPYRPRDTEL